MARSKQLVIVNYCHHAFADICGQQLSVFTIKKAYCLFFVCLFSESFSVTFNLGDCCDKVIMIINIATLGI